MRSKHLVARRVALSAFLSATAMLPAAAAAQEVPAPPGQGVSSEGQDIIVTAQKRSEKAINVPASLTVISEADLQRGGVTTNLGLTYVTPGLKMDRTGVNTAPALRGITSLVVGPGLDPNVATYIDGVYANDGASIVDLPDAQGVVVLKGPQGTLFGRNATGGAIQITTLKPSFTLTGNATISYGNLDDLAFKGFLSGPLISDVLAISLAGYQETNDGYLHDVVTNKRTGAFKAQLIRGKLLLQPASNVELTLAGYYSYHRDPAGTNGTVQGGISLGEALPNPIVPSLPYDIAENFPSKLNSKGYGGSFTGVFHFAPGTLTFIAAAHDNKTEVVNNNYSTYSPAGGNTTFLTQTDKAQSIELDFASRKYGSFNYIVGFYYYNNIGAYNPLQIKNSTPASITSIFGFVGSRSYSGFGEVNYGIFDKLTITAGIRYSTERRSIHGNGCGCDQTTLLLPDLDFGNKTFNAWTPRLSLRYEIANNTNVYFTYSKGFKSGGYNASSTLGNTPPLIAFNPEKLSAYEIGLKSAPTHLINISASAFYYKYKDQQVTSFLDRGGVTLLTTTNAAASTIYGADIEGSAQLSREFSLHTGISLLHARFDSFPAAVVQVPNTVVGPFGPVGNVAQNRNVAGNSLPRAPDWTVSIGATYEREFAAGTLIAKADLFRSARSYFDPGNLYQEPAYTNLDASIAWQLHGKKLTFTLWGKNLTDDVRTLGTVISRNGSTYFWAPPRTYGVSVSTKF
ncbi:MAG: hypothetical protein JWR80_1471 [Bradyrhizobium sp.]|nr:hypothetical protein [Bradyrhizobium sp.]